jgi:hypothetical protein
MALLITGASSLRASLDTPAQSGAGDRPSRLAAHRTLPIRALAVFCSPSLFVDRIGQQYDVPVLAFRVLVLFLLR